MPLSVKYHCYDKLPRTKKKVHGDMLKDNDEEQLVG